LTVVKEEVGMTPPVAGNSKTSLEVEEIKVTTTI
jgi:hypothetical protein